MNKNILLKQKKIDVQDKDRLLPIIYSDNLSILNLKNKTNFRKYIEIHLEIL